MARSYVVHEANLRQVRKLKPNVAILPWGATEAHNLHLPFGTDCIEATVIGEMAAERANRRGARCLVLPTVPFGVDHTQLYQVATITMRAATQQAVLYDVAESLVRQGIDRLVVLNLHGGNDFRAMIRDVMFDLPIFILQVNGWQTVPDFRQRLNVAPGDHADEFETSVMLHIRPNWVAPLSTAGKGATTRSKLPAITETPGVFCVRDWAALTKDTGVGDPRKSSAEKGVKLLDVLVGALVPVLVQLSKAKRGDFPFVIREG